ncbi:hypothetical protein ACFX14_034632 [Malus domestica]
MELITRAIPRDPRSYAFVFLNPKSAANPKSSQESAADVKSSAEIQKTAEKQFHRILEAVESRDLKLRSNSNNKDVFVFLNPKSEASPKSSQESATDGKSSAEIQKTAKKCRTSDDDVNTGVTNYDESNFVRHLLLVENFKEGLDLLVPSGK